MCCTKSKQTTSSNSPRAIADHHLPMFGKFMFAAITCFSLIFCGGPESCASTQIDEKSETSSQKEQSDAKQEEDADDKSADKLDGEMTESERRLKSLAKSIEKEDRPEKPSFNGRAAGNGVISFDDLKFEMKKSERFKRAMLTDSVMDLVGKRLQIKGFIHPNSKKRGMQKFIFVRDDKECCFGPTAALFDCVLVTLDEGAKAKYSTKPVTVEGQLYLKEFTGPDKRVWAVYRMKNSVIKN